MASENAPQSPRAEPDVPPAEPLPWVSTLTYRSRSVLPMSELELYRLLRAAQLRNHAEGVTGSMVYDAGWIFQQLEGPAEGLARIWDSIRHDPRHDHIEVLGDAPSRERRFAEWDLKLSIHGAHAGRAPAGVGEAPPELIERLSRGELAAALLPPAWLQAAADPVAGPLLRAVAQSRGETRAALTSLIHSVIIPRLTRAMPPLGVAASAQEPRVAALAHLLIATDKEAASALVKAAYALDGSLAALAAEVLEPAARGLGDLWLTDDCTEFDVTLGLTRLQAIMRELGAGTPRISSRQPPLVLITPQPGEIHMLGAALDAELLWRAGWNPRIDFPATSDALDSLLASTWVDALDLSTSAAFSREHRLGQLGETIAHARLASLNPHLIVVVSGRIFGDGGTGGEAGLPGRFVGADASFRSAAQAEHTILDALHLPHPPSTHPA